MMPPYNRATTRNRTRLHSLRLRHPAHGQRLRDPAHSLRLRDPAHSLPPHMTGNSQLLAAAAA